MISTDTLPQLLVQLGFSKHGASYSKTIFAATLKVDTKAQRITYPDGLIVNGEFTCNFSSSENFVVLECVHRLLEKGYKAEHIELEPKWKLGHGASGGRADILLTDNQKKPLLIIECKTAGREFDKAWRNTLQDGDQLFSYAQQISETQFLCLYASDFDNGEVTYQSHIIAHRDNEKYLADNPNFKSFAEVSDVKSRYTVWRDTYKLDYTSKGIFEGNIQPYHIGKDKYALADLQAISESDQQKKYHEFATILRQHNVSGRENAFDKLVNLFLCKLVDETENPHELKFYWKGVAYDTHFELLDRLQQLYQAGMGKFLGEQITYIDQSAVRNAMRFIKQNPDATQKAVWNLFVQQKFFTNNDFSLIDVHNEKLFYQNAEVLLKILQMWQDIRLTNNSGNNQFLGDMFEGFLDQGVKQSEGQYFTPMPICRFILMSLPLQSLIQNSSTPPKAIDYACGAGHFLNELASQLKPLVAQHKQADIAEYHKAIYGIEKEYRLSKVAKVSAFMYGQADINICYGDALVNQHAAFPNIQDGSFDVLVANPPYSVRGFLETLSEEERAAYSLADTIDKLDTANSIETFFIERAKQLLKPGGVAALILPSSILSNGGNTYVKTREILLQYFDLVAIAEFGSGTFGKTGTNTVTLFLRRKQTQPDTAAHYRERVAHWFDASVPRPLAGEGRSEGEPYQDTRLVAQYAAHIGVATDDYASLLQGQPNAALMAHDTFAQYRKAFDASTEIVNLNNQRAFKAKPAAEQQAELEKRLLTFVQSIERDKLFHFVMANDQANPVLIIRSPNDNKAQKQFLGYEWSSAKGNEGIQISKDANGHHLTPLYDETNRDNAEKINSLIAANFAPSFPSPSGRGARGEGAHVNENIEAKDSSAFPHPNPLPKGEGVVIPPVLREHVSQLRLVDMLDFSRVTFEKTFTLSTKTKLPMQSKWELKPIDQLLKKVIGNITKVEEREIKRLGNTPVVTQERGRIIAGYVDSGEQITDVPLIVFGDHSCTIKYVDFPFVRGADGTQLLKVDASEILPKFFFSVLQQLEIENSDKYERHFKYLKTEKIPLPPLDIQQRIVAECEAVDAEATAAQASISTAESEIIASIAKLQDGSVTTKTLQELCDIKRGRFTHRPRNEPRFFGGAYPFIQTGDVVRAVASKVPYTQTLNEEGLVVSKLFQPPVVLVTIAANIGDTAVLDYPACFTDSVVGLIPSADINARFLELMMRAQKKHLNEIAPQMAQKNINIEILKPIKVPVPPLADQQKLVAEIEALERDIASAQAVIAAAPAKKQAIMQRYL